MNCELCGKDLISKCECFICDMCGEKVTFEDIGMQRDKDITACPSCYFRLYGETEKDYQDRRAYGG